MTEKELLQIVSEIENNKDDKIDLKNIILRYIRNWYWFALTVLCVGLVAFIYLRYTTPQYEITSKILIKDDKNGRDFNGDAVFKDLTIFNGSVNVLNEIEVLKSQALMQRVLRELSFSCSYYLEGTFKNLEIYGRKLPVRVITNELDSTAYGKKFALQLQDSVSFQFGEINEEGDISKWDKYSFGEEIAKDYGIFSVRALTDIPNIKGRRKIIVHFNDIGKLAQDYSEKIEIELVNEDATILQIDLITAIPDKGKDIINTLIKVYNEEDLEDKSLIAANTLKFINDRLSYITSDLTGVEKNVEEFKKENELTDVSSEASMYVEEATDYSRQLAELDIQLDVLNSIESNLKKQGSKYALLPGSNSIPDPTLVETITKFNELLLERQRLLRTLPEENPLVQNVEDQLVQLRKNINQNLENVIESLQIKRKNILASSTKFKSRIERVPTMERRLQEISRQQGIKEKLYLYLLQKREESSMSLAATVSNLRVIDTAISSKEPVKPNHNLIYAIVLFLGIGIPIGGIYIKDITNDRVQTRKGVENYTRTPIVGELPHHDSSSQLVVTAESRDPVAEIFRLIRSNLTFLSLGEKNQVLLVTSSMHSEGKTFFSINFAASFALLGKKVLIMDFDLRKPNVLTSLNLSRRKGITDYLASDATGIEDFLIPMESMPELSILGSGTIPPNPNELMTNKKVGILIQKLREKFDYIIIDTAPVGLVADAFSLVPHIDSTLYMVRYNHTYKSQLEVVDDIYKNKKFKNLKIVLNDKQNLKKESYGYGYI